MPLTDSVVLSTFGRLSVVILAPLDARSRSALARIDDGGRLRTQITLVCPLTGEGNAMGAAEEEGRTQTRSAHQPRRQTPAG